MTEAQYGHHVVVLDESGKAVRAFRRRKIIRDGTGRENRDPVPVASAALTEAVKALQSGGFAPPPESHVDARACFFALSRGKRRRVGESTAR